MAKYKGWTMYFSEYLGLYAGRAVLLRPARVDREPEIRKEFRVFKDLALSPGIFKSDIHLRVRSQLVDLINEYEAAHG